MPDIRNIGILAHVDAGKTTLTEQLLYLCGAVRQPGNVDEGTAQTDWLEVEKRRGISVKTACARLEYGGGVVQLIDTPGHVDFAGEVERSLAALDGAGFGALRRGGGAGPHPPAVGSLAPHGSPRPAGDQ